MPKWEWHVHLPRPLEAQVRMAKPRGAPHCDYALVCELPELYTGDCSAFR